MSRVRFLSARYQTGFTMTELLITIACVGMLLLGVFSFGNRGTESTRVTKTIEHMRQISSGAAEWATGQYNYNGVSITVLQTARYLSTNLSVSPFGGTYTVAGNGSRFTITVPGFPDDAICAKVRDKIVSDTVTAPACSGGTLTATFGT